MACGDDEENKKRPEISEEDSTLKSNHNDDEKSKKSVLEIGEEGVSSHGVHEMVKKTDEGYKIEKRQVTNNDDKSKIERSDNQVEPIEIEAKQTLEESLELYYGKGKKTRIEDLSVPETKIPALRINENRWYYKESIATQQAKATTKVQSGAGSKSSMAKSGNNLAGSKSNKANVDAEDGKSKGLDERTDKDMAPDEDLAAMPESDVKGKGIKDED